MQYFHRVGEQFLALVDTADGVLEEDVALEGLVLLDVRVGQSPALAAATSSSSSGLKPPVSHLLRSAAVSFLSLVGRTSWTLLRASGAAGAGSTGATATATAAAAAAAAAAKGGRTAHLRFGSTLLQS